MKKIHRFNVFSFFLVVAYLLSACAGSALPVSNGGGDKPLPRPVTYVGLVEDIVGDQWTINGVTVTIGSDVLRDGPFTIGDQVKVEGVVNQDGSVTVSRLEAASADDLSTLPPLGDDTNTNDSSLTNANSNDDNGNDASLNNSNSNDDNGNDAVITNENDSNSNDSTSINENGNDSNSNSDDDDDDSGSNSNDDDGDDDNDDGGNGNEDNSNG